MRAPRRLGQLVDLLPEKKKGPESSRGLLVDRPSPRARREERQPAAARHRGRPLGRGAAVRPSPGSAASADRSPPPQTPSQPGDATPARRGGGRRRRRQLRRQGRRDAASGRRSPSPPKKRAETGASRTGERARHRRTPTRRAPTGGESRGERASLPARHRGGRGREDGRESTGPAAGARPRAGERASERERQTLVSRADFQ